jgi:hypothetical protein
MTENILMVEASKDSPEIYCNAYEGIVKITGCSTGAHVFDALREWFAEYAQNPAPCTDIEVRLEDFDGGTLGFFYCDFFRMLREIRQAKHDVRLVWYYDKKTRGHARLLLEKAQDDDDPDCNILFLCHEWYDNLFGFPLQFRKVKRKQGVVTADLHMEATDSTPLIRCTKYEEQLLVTIKGRSVPENHTDLYRPLFDWLHFYEDENIAVCVDIQWDYFDDLSDTYQIHLFELLREIHDNGTKAVVNWYYREDDDDMLERGEDFSSWVKFPFNLMMIE